MCVELRAAKSGAENVLVSRSRTASQDPDGCRLGRRTLLARRATYQGRFVFRVVFWSGFSRRRQADGTTGTRDEVVQFRPKSAPGSCAVTVAGAGLLRFGFVARRGQRRWRQPGSEEG